MFRNMHEFQRALYKTICNIDKQNIRQDWVADLQNICQGGPQKEWYALWIPFWLKRTSQRCCRTMTRMPGKPQIWRKLLHGLDRSRRQSSHLQDLQERSEGRNLDIPKTFEVSAIVFLHSRISNSISWARIRTVAVFAVPAGPVNASILWDCSFSFHRQWIEANPVFSLPDGPPSKASCRTSSTLRLWTASSCFAYS